MTVSVKRLTPVNGSGAVRAFVSVDVGGKLKIHDCRVVQQNGQEPWVSMPQQSYEKDGRRRWYPIIEVSQNLKSIISDAVLRAWRESGHDHGEADATPF